MTEDFHAFSENLAANPSTGKLSITPRKLTFTIQSSYLADYIVHSRFSKKILPNNRSIFLENVRCNTPNFSVSRIVPTVRHVAIYQRQKETNGDKHN